MREIDPASFQHAVLLGARVHAHVTGKTYFRRRLTQKQQTLIALLASGDSAGIEELSAAFQSEWSSLGRRKSGSSDLELHQAFFQNIADIASRINEYLAAGYSDADARAEMQAALGNRCAGLFWDHQRREIWAEDRPTSEELTTELIRHTAGRRRRRSKKKHQPEPQPPSQSNTTPDPPVSTRKANEPLPTEPTVSTPDEPILASVDPVTTRWTIDLGAGLVEVDPRLGLVRVRGLLIPWQGEPLPDHPQNLTARHLATLRGLL